MPEADNSKAPISFIHPKDDAVGMENNLTLFQDNPCLEKYSSKPDVMPPIETGWQKIIARIRPTR
jgi:hypothetical protein